MLHIFMNNKKIKLIFLLIIYTVNGKRQLFKRPQNVAESKIVGGEETTIEQVPYLVNLRQNGYFICGGALVTPKCVLTAAHCAYNTKPDQLTVYGGSSKLSATAEVRQVVQNFVSPFFTPANLNTDVAILKLAAPLQGPNIATIPICSQKPGDNEIVKVSGWGVTSEGNRNPPDQVRTVNVPVISRLNCLSAYAGQALITSSMFCAAVPGEKDSCSGDSGGPVVYNGQVCGIVSWGFGCASPNYPGVYANVASLRVKGFIMPTILRNCQ